MGIHDSAGRAAYGHNHGQRKNTYGRLMHSKNRYRVQNAAKVGRTCSTTTILTRLRKWLQYRICVIGAPVLRVFVRKSLNVLSSARIITENYTTKK